MTGTYRPLVSIVMATYRRPHTIFRTVAQIVAQTYPHWELIVVDNARTGEYQFDDPRIRVYRHAHRASASYARNQGIQHATGELLCFFDDDDDMAPTYLERFVGAFEAHPGARMARCGCMKAAMFISRCRVAPMVPNTSARPATAGCAGCSPSCIAPTILPALGSRHTCVGRTHLRLSS